MSRYYLLCCLLIPALCPETQASDEEVLNLLQGYEWKLQEQAFHQLGEAAVSSLIEIAEDENQVNFIRARAATALTLFPGDAAWDYYESEITVAIDRVAIDRVRRRQLVQNFCTSFALTRPQQVEAMVMPLLREPDAHLKASLLFGWVTRGQLLSVPMIVIGMGIFYWAYRYRRTVGATAT